MKKILLILPLLTILIISTFLLIFLLQKKDPNKPPSALLNENLPEFTMINLFDEKKTITNNDIQNQFILINFFASWCAPCKAEHSFFFDIKKDYPYLLLIGVNHKDIKLDAINYLKKYRNPYDYVGVDNDGLIGLDLGVFGLPETFLVNVTGKVIYKYLGPLTKEVIKNEIYPLIK